MGEFVLHTDPCGTCGDPTACLTYSYSGTIEAPGSVSLSSEWSAHDH